MAADGEKQMAVDIPRGTDRRLPNTAHPEAVPSDRDQTTNRDLARARVAQLVAPGERTAPGTSRKNSAFAGHS